MLMKREMLSCLRDHGASLHLQQCCLTLWLVPPQGGWRSLCPGERFPSPQAAPIWAVCFAAVALPASPLMQSWLLDGGFSNYAPEETGWTLVCGRHSHPSLAITEQGRGCVPLLRDYAMPLGCPFWYGLFQALCWAAARATFSASSLPGHPIHCSVALPVIPMTFFESFHFSAATFSCQLVNMVIIQGAHIKAKLSWYSSFHMLLSLSVPRSSDLSPWSLLFLQHPTQTLCLCSAR